jgi:hypothetical protein
MSHLWVPVSAGDCSAGEAVLKRIALGLSRRDVIRLTELDRLAWHLPDRPTRRDLREAVDGTRHTEGQLCEYHRRVRREVAERRAGRRNEKESK